MKAPISWLKQYVDIDVDAETVANKLLNVGFEVDEIIRLDKGLEKVVVGEIIALNKHENADSLQICSIDVGEACGGVLQIVTGATNVFVGAKIPVALVGASLPNGVNIKPAKLRGVESFGMLCSGGELNIDDEVYPGASVNGILILDAKETVGKGIADVIGYNDEILDIEITANRPDCQSIYGIAREVAACLGKKCAPLNLLYVEDKHLSIKDFVKVSVLDSKLCNRYIAKAVKDVKIFDSPEYIKRRLRSVGIRPINNIVDITNYVLTEVGQPMHSFDLNNITGGEIVVRRARSGERIRLLNEQEIELNENILAICDAERPLAIAGIMGGEESGISDSTSTVVFESAKFARDCIRKTSKAIGVRSDSSARFEKGVDAYTTDVAMRRALSLICEENAGTVVGLEYDLNTESVKDRTITFAACRIDNLLGIKIDRSTMTNILNLLDIQTTISDDDNLTCKIPGYREDIENYADIAEEVIRYYGYDHIEGTLLSDVQPTVGGLTPKQKFNNRLKNELVDLGLCEAVSYSFVSPKFIQRLGLTGVRAEPIKLINPLGEELSVMRTTLVHSMLEILASNFKKKNAECRLFELADVYVKNSDATGELPNQYPSLCIGAYGDCDFFTFKAYFESVLDLTTAKYTLKRSVDKYLHPGRSADVFVDDVKVGSFGEVAPDSLEDYEIATRAYVGELNISYLYSYIDSKFSFKPIAKFPSIERDLAFIVDDSVSMQEIKEIIVAKSGKLLEDVSVFDVYKGDQISSDKKSIAFSLKFTCLDRTLTDDEIEHVVKKIITEVENKLGGVLR